MEPVSHMTEYNSYSNYMGKCSTNFGIKSFLDSWKCHSKLKATLRKEFAKLSVVFLTPRSMAASKKHVSHQYHTDFTVERNESNVSVEDNMLKINQCYFLRFPI